MHAIIAVGYNKSFWKTESVDEESNRIMDFNQKSLPPDHESNSDMNHSCDHIHFEADEEDLEGGDDDEEVETIL
ncbi:hypothetical protein KSP40_PGU005052 [Platanthera guangdongensis]|uniref:Uncharacterized protein n=1 Tax=Platanthera guangdongensis TaxID=2320717 RepID=A0ABR2M0X5_9ASPA